MSNKQETIKRIATRLTSIISILLIGIIGYSQNAAIKVSADAHTRFVIEGGDTTYLKVDVDPMYPGGDAAWRMFLTKTLHYQ